MATALLNCVNHMQDICDTLSRINKDFGRATHDHPRLARVLHMQQRAQLLTEQEVATAKQARIAERKREFNGLAESMEDHLEEMRREKSRLEGETSRLNSAISQQADAEAARLRAEHESAMNDLATQQQVANTRLKELNQTIEAKQALLEQLEAQAEAEFSVEHHGSDLIDAIRQHQADLKAANSQLATLHAQHEQQERGIAALNAELDALKAAKEARAQGLQKEAMEQAELSQELQAQLDAYVQQSERLQAQISLLHSELQQRLPANADDMFSALMAEKEAEIAAVQEQQRTVRTSTLPAAERTFAEKIGHLNLLLRNFAPSSRIGDGMLKMFMIVFASKELQVSKEKLAADFNSADDAATCFDLLLNQFHLFAEDEEGWVRLADNLLPVQ